VAELVWKGKVGRRPTIRSVSLRTDETYGSGAEPNRLVHGDASEVLTALAKPFAGLVSLVYIDPPFDTGQSFNFQTPVPGAKPGAPRIAIEAYRDDRGLDRWLAWFFDISERLRDLLAPGGSLYVHLDAHVAHYAKVVLDEILGIESFQREIIWRIGWISGFKSRVRGWIRNHDTILFYAKGGRPSVFHKEYIPYPEGYVRRDGAAPRGQGYPIEDVWNGNRLDPLDSIQIVSFSREKLGYPTQKNEALLARIVRASSRPGDLVLDCFAGSGTTAAVAEKLGRRWIASDSSPISLHVTRKRLLGRAGPKPFITQSSSSSSSPRLDLDAGAKRGRSEHAAGGGDRRVLRARAKVNAKGRVTVEIASLRVPKAAAPEAVRARVTHWAQWIDAWCVDWDYRRGPMNVSSYVSRKTAAASLDLVLGHTYTAPGKYVALVKAFDILGGQATTTLEVTVE
jgi:DNA modification methylase